MIDKKNPKHSLEKNRMSVFTIGLFAAGSFTLAAFTYESPVQSEEERITSNQSEVDYVAEVAPKKEETLKPVITKMENQQTSTTTMSAAVTQEITVTASGQEIVTSDVSIEGLPFLKGDFDHISIEAVEAESEIVPFPDNDAEFVGGYTEMTKFIHNNLLYPEISIELREQGRVEVRFVVEKDGTVSNVDVIRGNYKNLNREASRIIRSFPKWIPGTVKGKNVRTYVSIPVVFTLE